MNRHKVYLAGPLFTFGDRAFNRELALAICKLVPDVTFILPQEYAEAIYGQERFAERVFEFCIRSVDEADAVLCIVDGADADSGTCVELGYAYARKKPILGIRTDFRSSEDDGVNIMVRKTCSEYLWLPNTHLSMQEIVEALVKAFDRLWG